MVEVTSASNFRRRLTVAMRVLEMLGSRAGEPSAIPSLGCRCSYCWPLGRMKVVPFAVKQHVFLLTPCSPPHTRWRHL